MLTVGIARLRQSGRHRADDRHALGLQVEHGESDNGDDDDDERAGQAAIHAAHDEQRRHADDANDDGEQVRFVEAADELQHLPEELVALELDAEHLAQLAADHDQRRAKDVADQDRLGQEVGDEPQLRHAGEQRQDADQDRGHRGQRGIAHRVAAGQRRNGGGGHDGGRRFGSHDELFGGAKQRVHHHGAESNIQPCDGSDAGEIAVGHRRRHEHRKDRDRHNEFGAQQRRIHALEEGKTGNETCNAFGRSGSGLFIWSPPCHILLRYSVSGSRFRLALRRDGQCAAPPMQSASADHHGDGNHGRGLLLHQDQRKERRKQGALKAATSAPAIVAATATATGILGNKRFAARPRATLANMMGKI